MEKSEILEYCEKNSLSFVTDSTNTDTDYTRNLIRAKIIPIMQEINSGAVRNAQRTCENLREDSLCLESMAGWFVEELRDGYAVEVEKISGSPASVVNRALIRLFDEISGGKTLEQTHLNSLKELARKAVPHSSVSLPCEFEGVIEGGRLCLRKKEKKEAIEYYETELFEGRNLISQTNSEIFIGNSQNAKNIYKKSTILYIDSAKIRGTLVARQRRAGDRIRIGGMSKSVKKLMCDKKIPLELRSRLPVICDEDGIIAIPLLATKDGAAAKNNNNATVIQFYLY
jgi:tRNA(Ile)-lysidine synthase